MNNRQLFLQHVAQTSPSPVGLEVVKAEGNYIYDAAGKAYLDLIGGISVCNVGHRHPAVIAAIQQQLDSYLHVMVYGELVQGPQVQYAQLLASLLPAHLNTVYFTNSGSEATDGALKLARRATGRPGIIACNNSYHGHTMGALSVMGDEYWRAPFRPLLPGVLHHTYNSDALIDAIDVQTAAVLIETVQAEAGVIAPEAGWLQRLRERCTANGTLLIFDEIQTGFGRTGTLWGFERLGVLPDIVLLGKALGGGMPLGAFVASQQLMGVFTDNPVLGHITTFGGHPVCCAAGKAALEALISEQMVAQVAAKASRFYQLLSVVPGVHAISYSGLLMAVQLKDAAEVQRVLAACLQYGLFSDWFLFAPNCIRIAPPLTITMEQIETACALLTQAIANA
ncbi:MAG: aspartate aminotransferase family protein [Chitinophagia bacterium]|nr:aspartate aminotransferase family protein [Chitinophagia bacterium]